MSISSTYRSRLLVAALVACQTIIPIAASASPVRLAGEEAFNVTTGGVSRAATIQKNLDNALVATTARTPACVKIVYVKGQPVITVGGFYVTTVDSVTAKAAKTTPSLLAQKWATGIKSALKDQASVDNYVSQITSSGTSTAAASTTTTSAGSYPYYRQGKVVYVPAGMMIPVALTSSLSTLTARVGDPIEAQIAETVNLGDTSIPQGSRIVGQVTEASAGEKMNKSGMLGIKFTDLRTPDGQDVPITAHIVGSIGEYQQVGYRSNLVQGESSDSKLKQALVRGAIGAGSGAVLGTAIGGIAGHGGGAGRGAVAGTILGGLAGVADSYLRKGQDVQVQRGQTLNLQLDAPASLAVMQSGSM